MWSYYSEGHTGVCVHFDAMPAVGSPFALAQRVVYSEKYPEIPLPFGVVGGGNRFITLALLTKSNAWEHEEEYRLINLPRDETEDPPRILDDLFLWKASQLAVMQQRPARR